MSKAFTRDDSDTEGEADEALGPAAPARGPNYLHAHTLARLRAELLHLIDVERPKVVDTVAWAAGNGDRSENGDYIYGKKRLREIDRRIRHLTGRIDNAVVVDPSVHHGRDEVFFGATVAFRDIDPTGAPGAATEVTIVGVDEAEGSRISWLSPVARALLKARVGDEVRVHTPSGMRTLEVLDVRYPPPGATNG